MKGWKPLGLVLAIGLAAVVFVVFDAPDRRLSAQGTKRQGRSFEAQFWNYLRQVHYRNWAPAAGQDGEFYPGKSPHGAHLKMYLNRIAVANPKELPVNSIIIKENYDKAKKLESITVMYRVPKFDPDHNDWYWVKYKPNGTVATTSAKDGGKPLAGRVKSCIDCHSTAKGGDYFFANDK